MENLCQLISIPTAEGGKDIQVLERTFPGIVERLDGEELVPHQI